jgi:hypothetical protein
MVDRTSQLGAKLGPRLASLMTESVINARRHLAPLEREHRIHAGRHLVDWMGHELGDIMAPIAHPVLKDAKIPPHIKAVLTEMTSGKSQWQALAGMAWGASGVGNVLGTIMNNYLAGIGYETVGADPLLLPDITTLIQLTLHGTLSRDDAVRHIGQQGINADFAERMILAATPMPDITTLIQMWRLGQVGQAEVLAAIETSGLPPIWAERVMAASVQPLTPADAALGLLRGTIDQATAYQIADHNGVSHADLDVLVANTGEPPGPEQLVMLNRRGVISDADLERGIRQSRVRDEWIPAMKALGTLPPTPAEVIDALVKGQTDQATALQRYREAGGDESWFTTAYDTAGATPTPTQLGVLANRGIIPWDGSGPASVSFQQGFHEGEWKNKWEPYFRQLAVYLPPPRTVTALVNSGSLPRAEGVRLLQDQGLAPDLAAAYVVDAHRQKTITQHTATVGMVEQLYEAQAIDKTRAETMLYALGYEKADADVVLATADLKRVTAALTHGISLVQSQYVAREMDRVAASGALDAMGIRSQQRDSLLATWDKERAVKVKVLTPAQVLKAVKLGVLTAEQGTARLVQQGYSAEDAAILVTIDG